MAEELICNYKKCRKKLGSFGWVTSCSHIYCDEDGTREFSKSSLCPACNTNLPGKLDLIRTDLCPSEQHKAMVLAGLKPEVIMEICSRAMAFWSYQVHQERVYQEYTATKAKQRGTQVEHYYEQLLSRAQSEVTFCSALKNQISAVKKELATTKKQYNELAEKAKEKSRQHQKLQMMYDALRRQSISMSGVDTREGRNDKTVNRFGPTGFQVFPCSEDHQQVRHIQYPHHHGPGGDINRTVHQSPPEREFVLLPTDSAASTPQHRTRANLSAVQDRFNSDFIGTPNDIRRALGPRKL